MPSTALEGLEPWALECLRVARVAHLALLDDEGAPRILPVTFALMDGAVWSAVDHKPKRHGGELARVRWLRARARSALAVDHYDEDWTKLAWVQLLGLTEIRDAKVHSEVLDALAQRYRQYRDRPPDGPLLRLVPVRALAWRAAG